MLVMMVRTKVNEAVRRNFSPMAQRLLVGQVLIIEASQLHSVEFLRENGQPDTEAPTQQHATLTTHRHPRLRRGSNSGSEQASGDRPTP